MLTQDRPGGFGETHRREARHTLHGNNLQTLIVQG